MSGNVMRADCTYLSAAYEYGGPAQAAGDMMRSLPEFPKMKTLLDLGGAAGFFSIAIVAAHPCMTAEIFEQSLMACMITREFIRQYQLSDRISVMKADFLSNSPGGSYDLIVASALLKKNNLQRDKLLTRLYETLNPGGMLLRYQDGKVELLSSIC